MFMTTLAEILECHACFCHIKWWLLSEGFCTDCRFNAVKQNWILCYFFVVIDVVVDLLLLYYASACCVTKIQW